MSLRVTPYAGDKPHDAFELKDDKRVDNEMTACRGSVRQSLKITPLTSTEAAHKDIHLWRPVKEAASAD